MLIKFINKIFLENHNNMVRKKECEIGKFKKRGQVTIFIILAIAILVVLVLLFLNRGSFVVSQDQSPVYQIQQCMSDAAKQGIEIMNSQGGSMNPAPSYQYNGSRIQYLCYTNQYYGNCVMQKPLLKEDYEKELTTIVQPKVNSCLNSVKDSLVQNGYTVNYKTPSVSVQLVMNSVVISANNLSLDITKSNTEKYDSVKTQINSNLYNMLMIASSISDTEAHYGRTEIMSYMMNYPQLKVDKLPQDDGTKIYILNYKDTGEKFIFAIRSQVLPAGITGK